MKFTLKEDNESQNRPMCKGADLPWTLWEDDDVWGFYKTRKEAVEEMEGLIRDAHAEIASYERQFLDAHNWLADLVGSQIT